LFDCHASQAYGATLWITRPYPIDYILHDRICGW
jgi:hypothetical protein